MNAIIDISRVIASDSVVYPGDPPLRHHDICAVSQGDSFSLTAFSGWSSHLLTHVDASSHFLADGASLDAVPLARFLGRCVVVEVAGDRVEARDVMGAGVGRGGTVLFKTRNSAIPTNAPFREDHAHISPEAAQAAAELGLNMVGFDYIDVERGGDSDYPVHNTLLRAGVLILEGLDLSPVAAGEYGFSALPLRIERANGAPVRAVLFADSLTGHGAG